MPDLVSIFNTRAVTWVLLALIILGGVMTLGKRNLYLACILHPNSIIKRREYYRLFISDFVHNDLGHLLVNGSMTFLICGELEKYLVLNYSHSHLLFLLIYTCSHFAGVLSVTWTNRSDYGYSSAGASGSILGCMMAFMIIAPGFTAFYLPVIGDVKNMYAALAVILGLIIYKYRSANEYMDNELHFFSALGGIAAAMVILYSS